MVNKPKHEMYGTPTYRSWMSMIQRCTSPSARSYENYGARGIKVCKRWLHKFDYFFEDMGVRLKGKTLERINNNGGYTKANCRWATRAEQSVNRRSNRLLTFRNKTQPMSVWSKELNISYSTLVGRKTHGWSDERALSTPGDARERLLTAQDVTMSVKKWAATKGINSPAILGRLKGGWSPEDAVNTGVAKQRFCHVRNVNVVAERVGVSEQVGVMLENHDFRPNADLVSPPAQEAP